MRTSMKRKFVILATATDWQTSLQEVDSAYKQPKFEEREEKEQEKMTGKPLEVTSVNFLTVFSHLETKSSSSSSWGDTKK